MSTSGFLGAFTLFHVAISLVGIMAGFVVAFAMLGSHPGKGWTATFLWTTLATSITGFLFPLKGITPAVVFGIISILVLAVTFYAYYARKLAGGWRAAYVVTALFALYLNVFVLIVQSFLKIPAINALAPTQKEPPFAIAQGLALVFFLGLGFFALKKYRPATEAA